MWFDTTTLEKETRMTWDCRPQSAGAETGALAGLEGKEYLVWPRERCQINGTGI